MQTCIMSSLPHCIFRCSVFRYVTLVSFVFLFKLCYLIVTLLLWWRINTYLLTKSRRTFKKGYLPSWTQEIFTVTKIIPRVPPVYRLRDYADDEIEGVFYAEELQKVQKSDDIYKIEKILAEKKENGKVKVLVKWLGYDKKFNSWLPKSELRKL